MKAQGCGPECMEPGWQESLFPVFPSYSLYLLSITWSPWTWSSLIQRGWLASEFQGSTSLPPQCWGDRDMLPYLAFHMGVGGPSTGLHALYKLSSTWVLYLALILFLTTSLLHSFPVCWSLNFDQDVLCIKVKTVLEENCCPVSCLLGGCTEAHQVPFFSECRTRGERVELFLQVIDTWVQSCLVPKPHPS